MEVSRSVLLLHSENGTFQHWDRERACSVLSGKWHLVIYCEKDGAYRFFWCLLCSYCSHLQFFSWWDLTSPLKKAGNLHLLKDSFSLCDFDLLGTASLLYCTFSEIPLFMNSQEIGFHSSAWFKLTKSSVIFFQLVKLFLSDSFGFGIDYSSRFYWVSPLSITCLWNKFSTFSL